MDPIRKEFESAELKELIAKAYPTEKKKPAPKKPTTATVDNGDLMSPNRLNIRVGKIVDIKKVCDETLLVSWPHK